MFVSAVWHFGRVGLAPLFIVTPRIVVAPSTIRRWALFFSFFLLCLYKFVTGQCCVSVVEIHGGGVRSKSPQLAWLASRSGCVWLCVCTRGVFMYAHTECGVGTVSTRH